MPVEPSQATILIVDDLKQNVDLLGDLLEKTGHHILKATSGESALAIVHQTPPDLVLLDINMPVMTGYEVCQTLQADELTRHIPVIFISALDQPKHILQGFEVGGVDYISKPFNFQEVMARVRTHLTLAEQRKEIERLREIEKQQFEEITQMRDHFTRATAHDLKSPLSTILSYSKMLQEAEPGDATIPVMADGIRQSAEKMQRLVMDILELAQMQSGENLRLFPTPIKPLLEKVCRNMEVVAQEKGIALALHLPDEKVVLEVDGHRIERVLDNLISNAIKYTPAGGVVDVDLIASDDYLQISVQDTGYGIPPDELPHIFNAFYRVKDKQHQKIRGTGLGLSIVKAIVEQHHGQVTVESEPGKGSLFTVHLAR